MLVLNLDAVLVSTKTHASSLCDVWKDFQNTWGWTLSPESRHRSSDGRAGRISGTFALPIDFSVQDVYQTTFSPPTRIHDNMSDGLP